MLELKESSKPIGRNLGVVELALNQSLNMNYALEFALLLRFFENIWLSIIRSIH